VETELDHERLEFGALSRELHRSILVRIDAWCVVCAWSLRSLSSTFLNSLISAMPDGIASPAVRAPDFPDTLDWLHTTGRRLSLGDFRGKLLLLDFWTYG